MKSLPQVDQEGTEQALNMAVCGALKIGRIGMGRRRVTRKRSVFISESKSSQLPDCS